MRRVRVLLLVIGLSLTMATASGFWTVLSVVGGSGAAASSSVNQGSTPTATAVGACGHGQLGREHADQRPGRHRLRGQALHVGHPGSADRPDSVHRHHHRHLLRREPGAGRAVGLLRDPAVRRHLARPREREEQRRDGGVADAEPLGHHGEAGDLGVGDGRRVPLRRDPALPPGQSHRHRADRHPGGWRRLPRRSREAAVARPRSRCRPAPATAPTRCTRSPRPAATRRRPASSSTARRPRCRS